MQKLFSIAAARRRAVAAQGYAQRFLLASADDIVECVRRLTCVQLDSIATVERSHLIVLGSRIGQVAPGAVSKLLAAGKLFEYWAHEACLLEISDYPLWRRRMRERREQHHWWGPVIESNRPLAKQILDTIRERGALGSRHFEGKGGGGMWNLKPAKKTLDALWTAGELAVCGRQGFQRLYDLPERIIPAAILNAPLPSESDARLTLVQRAVQARGVLTASGVVNHYKLAGGVAAVKQPLAALVRSGELQMLDVEDGGAPIYLMSNEENEALENRANAVLLSPFENLLWDRELVRRLFKFSHLIEVYKRQEQREFGYYVLPFLMNDKLIGRVDLKAHRDEGTLRVKAFHLEPGVKNSSAVKEGFARAFTRLARTLGLTATA